MNLEKETVIEGYAAFTKDGKGLRNRWSGGGQTGTEVQSLTTDISNVTITRTKGLIQMYTVWFNTSHKNKVEFEIRPVKFIAKNNLQILG